MKKLVLALLTLALTACSMTQPQQAGPCLETGFDLQCSAAP